VSLIVLPEDGISPILSAINKAKATVDIGIFRLDRADIAKALRAAVDRGVAVRTLIAHTNRGGEKRLRKLELNLLKTGASVRRTDDDLRRYHNKIMIVDRAKLFVLGFNYTALDVDKSRSFGLVTKKRELVREAIKLFEADSLRLPYAAGPKAFIVSPVNARERLAIFLRGARKTLLLYDPKLTDPMMIRILHERRAAGVSVRILGSLGKRGVGLSAEKFPGRRLHVRAIVRDSHDAFMGSQGLRKLELDGRREVGVIVRDPKVVTRMSAVFEADWALTDRAKQDVIEARKDSKTAAKMEAAVIAGAKAEVKAEGEARAEAKAELKAESKAEVKAEARVEAKAAQAEEQEAKAEKKEAKAEKKEAKAEKKAEKKEAKAEAKAESKSDAVKA
jgi:phosphatidylserine/phosphatidylglycerophosphate/cardiolipin synthase-like enzyme